MHDLVCASGCTEAPKGEHNIYKYNVLVELLEAENTLGSLEVII